MCLFTLVDLNCVIQTYWITVVDSTLLIQNLWSKLVHSHFSEKTLSVTTCGFPLLLFKQQFWKLVMCLYTIAFEAWNDMYIKLAFFEIINFCWNVIPLFKFRFPNILFMCCEFCSSTTPNNMHLFSCANLNVYKIYIICYADANKWILRC